MLSLSSNAHAAPSAPAESHDGDFHAVLASYVPAAQPARDVPRDTRAVKPVKAIERAHPAANPAKTSHKEEKADGKSASKKPERDSKSPHDAEQAQVIPSQQTQPLPARIGMAAQQRSPDHDDRDASDETVQATPGDTSRAVAASSSATAPAIKAASPQDIFSSAAKPIADPVRAEQGKPLADPVRADRQKSATTPLPKAVMDEIAAAAKAPQVQQSKVAANEPFAATKSEQTQPTQQPAPSATPQRPQSIVANIITMLNAARGTITVTQPKSVVAANTDMKPDTASAKSARVADSAASQPQASTPDRALNAPKFDVRDTSNDDAMSKPVAAGSNARAVTASDKNDDAVPKPTANSDVRVATASDKTARDMQSTTRDNGNQVSEGIAKADAAPAAQAAQPATPQSTPNANVAISAAVPNAVNVTAPAAASGPQRPAPADAHGTDQPNLSALATAIAVKSASGTKTFDIRMDPPELGRVDVHLSVDRDGKVQAMLSAEHPRTLELLQRDSQHLERALKDAGLDLSNNSLNFSLKGEGRQGDGGGASTARARNMPNAVVARAEAANASVSNFNYASGDGRLDIRV